MKKLNYYRIYIVVSSLLFIFTCSSAGVRRGNPLASSSAQELIKQAVFEVIVTKPTKDSLTYEKKLPFDKLPYSTRNDKYYSIGSAFCIRNQGLVTAAHVLDLGNSKKYTKLFIRDQKKKVYEISDIVKFSNDKDFVVFKVKGKTFSNCFGINSKYALNKKVYAAGNALGEGIIIRDGLYTSNTPEDKKGSWKWIRFSAAASPGNSGGPLLDNESRVIGVVLRKSKNENLNYALPINIVTKASSAKVAYDEDWHFRFTNLNYLKKRTMKFTVKLPESIERFNTVMFNKYKSLIHSLAKEYFSEYRKKIFPFDKKSLALLHTSNNAVFPRLIGQNKNNEWMLYYPKEKKSEKIGSDGALVYGNMYSHTFLMLQPPSKHSLRKTLTDSKLYMDYILRGIYVSRDVAGESIRITSFGKAKSSKIFKDSYGRKWLEQSWDMEFNNKKIVSFSLPIPGGIIAILKQASAGSMDLNYLPDLKKMLDFIYFSYYGTFKEWKKLLKLKKYLPDQFQKMKFSFNKKKIKFKFKNFQVKYSKKNLKISKKSDLKLYMGFYKETGKKKKVKWGLTGLTFGEDEDTNRYFSIFRIPKPEKGLDKSYFKSWKKMIKRKKPFNMKAFNEKGKTYIKAIHPKSLKKFKSKYLYSFTYGFDKKVSKKKAKSTLKSIVKGVKFK